MTNTDTMFLPRLGLEKRVIFCVIPDNDKTYNFLITMLYTQLFDQLFRLADSEPKFDGALPVHVRFMMDEFANVALPANFKNILAVCRSRNISCDIILQSKSQIQSLYKDDWEGMIGNCDSLIYLGGNEYATFEWLSKYIGKMTERTKSQSIGAAAAVPAVTAISLPPATCAARMRSAAWTMGIVWYCCAANRRS